MPPRDWALAFLVPLIWGLGVTFAKAGLDEFPPLFLMGLRFSLTALILVWFVEIPRGKLRAIFWVAAVGATLQYGLTFTGLLFLDASLAIILIQLEVPFATMLGALLLSERPGRQRLAGIAIAFAGVALIAGQPTLQGQLWPMLLVVGGAFTWSVAQIMVKRLGGGIGGFALIAWVGVFGGPQMILASLVLESGQLEALRTATWVGWGTVVYLGVVMTALGYGIWYHVLAKHPVGQVAPVLLTLPVFTILGSMALLGERLQPSVALGGAVVVAGVATIVLKRGSMAAKPKGAAGG